MSDFLPPIGCTKEELPTPCLHLCLDRLDANIQSMVTSCRKHDVQWRPHAKCHKSPVIARWLIDAGACGVTCATIREAEIMVEHGITDLMSANMIAGPVKVTRLAQLARQADLVVCVDHVDQATAISDGMVLNGGSVRALVELEVGMNRVGTAQSAALQLARQLNALPGIELAGLMAYEGHLLTVDDPEQKSAAIAEAMAGVMKVRDQLLQDGLPCPVVSCGGTGSWPVTVQQPGVTELQAGGAIFMDAFYRNDCHIENLQHALSVLTTVVSLPTPERVIIDAGRKAMNMDISLPRTADIPGLTVDWLSAEHGVMKRSVDAPPLQIGQQIELIPGYGDLTNMLHAHFFGFRNRRLEQVIPIVR